MPFNPSPEKNEKEVDSKFGGRTPEEPSRINYFDSTFEIVPPAKPYIEEDKIINGVKMDLRWVEGESCYQMYLRDAEPENQIINISERPEVAKQVFAYAAELALEDVPVDEMYNQIQDFKKDLPYEIEK